MRRADPPAGGWQTEVGDSVHTGVRIRRLGPTIFFLFFTVCSAGFGVLWFNQNSTNPSSQWIGCSFTVFCIVAGLFGALQAGRGAYELIVSPGTLVVRRSAGPITFTRRFRAVDVRKVERVEQVSTTDGKRLGTRFYVFPDNGRAWMFGNNLSEPEADHLWAALSKGRKSSARIDRISPSPD